MTAPVAAPAGIGVGWRPEISGWVSDRARTGLGFTEVIAEAVHPTHLPRGLVELRERGVPVIAHGVRLSLGGTDPLDRAKVTHLAACAEALGSPFVSEHVAFCGAGGLDVGHMLALPRTRDALDVLVANVRRTQAELGVPLALEPIASFLDWPESTMSEPEFLSALIERTDALLLLDVANLYANAVNRGEDPSAVLGRMPLHAVAYVHVAGGSEHVDDPGVYHDTHTDPVPPQVLELVGELVERTGTAPPVMLERDGRYPPAAQLDAELDAIAAAVSPAGHRVVAR